MRFTVRDHQQIRGAVIVGVQETVIGTEWGQAQVLDVGNCLVKDGVVVLAHWDLGGLGNNNNLCYDFLQRKINNCLIIFLLLHIL